MRFSRLPVVRASELAKLAICEQKAMFEREYGEKLTGEATRRVRDGNVGHERYLQQAFTINPKVRSSHPRRSCFIATAVFGESAPETQALRSFRDQFLVRNAAGRTLARMYDRVSPGVARFVRQRPWASGVMRFVLRPVAGASRWLVRKLGSSPV